MTRIKCLNKGFVELVDVMGNDSAIVQAARVSVAGEGVKATSEDRALIRYLMRHKHTTPLEMVVFKFHAKMPIFVARQWVRHRMATINEMSARYGELPKEFYIPDLEHVNPQAENNKQGRLDEVLPNAEKFRAAVVCNAHDAFDNYHEWLDRGVARELARVVLPLSTYTEWFWKIDLHNLLHFLSLRLDKHAQYEIRVYAEAIAEMVKAQCPLAWEAFEDFRLHALTLSRHEVMALSQLLQEASARVSGDMLAAAEFPTMRERAEWRDKLTAFGVLT